MLILQGLSKFILVLPVEDPVSRYAEIYSQRIQQCLARSQHAGKFQQEMHQLVMRITRKDKPQAQFVPDLTEELKQQFADVENQPKELYDENEQWSIESLSFKYFNLLANYKATKNVSRRVTCARVG